MPDLFRAVGMAAWAMRSALACTLRGRVWLPFVLIAAVQGAALLLLVNFHRSPLAGFAVPIVESVAGDRATHYPVFFIALPAVYSRVVLILSVFLTCVMIGAATVLFAQAFGLAPRSPAWRRAWRCYPGLFGVTAVLAALLFGVSYARQVVPEDVILHNSPIRWATRGVILGLSLLVQSLLAYAAAWVVLRGKGLWGALRGSMQITGSVWLPTLLVVALPVLILFPLNYAASRGDILVGKFRPEVVVALLSVQIVLELLLGFVLVGAITRIFLYQVEESR